MTQLYALISAIGRNRFIMLVILLIVNGGIAAVWQKVLLPKQEELTAQLSQVQAERSRLQTEIRELPAKHAALEAAEARYVDLEKHGLFAPQDRIEARTRMGDLRQAAAIRGVDYRIDPQSVIDTPSLVPTNNQLVLSKVGVELKGLTDHDLVDFLTRMQTQFNGLVIVKSFTMERANDVNDENLKKLQNKQPVDFVSSKAEFEWYNISPKTADTSSPMTQAFQGSAP